MAFNLKEDIRPISYIKANAADVMNSINERKSPIVITQNGEARAVLLDIESYQSMRSAFTLLNIFKIAEDEYHSGNRDTLDTVINQIEEEFFPE